MAKKESSKEQHSGAAFQAHVIRLDMEGQGPEAESFSMGLLVVQIQLFRLWSQVSLLVQPSGHGHQPQFYQKQNKWPVWSDALPQIWDLNLPIFILLPFTKTQKNS